MVLIAADQLVLYHSQLEARPKAPSRVVQNMKSWLEDNKGAIHDLEAEFVDKEDLIPIVHHEKTFLRRGLESFGWFRRLPLFRKRKVRQYSLYLPDHSTD